MLDSLLHVGTLKHRVQLCHISDVTWTQFQLLLSMFACLPVAASILETSVRRSTRAYSTSESSDTAASTIREHEQATLSTSDQLRLDVTDLHAWCRGRQRSSPSTAPLSPCIALLIFLPSNVHIPPLYWLHCYFKKLWFLQPLKKDDWPTQ